MANRYLLPCSCGKKLPVAATQAGETIVCTCGNRITVPTLRGLRELKQETAASTAAAPPARRWSAVQGYMFSLGILTAIVGGAIGAYQLFMTFQLKPHTVDQTAAANASMDADVDKMSPLETLEEWQHATEHGLGNDGSPGWVEAQKLAAGYRRNAVAAFIVAGLGVLALAAALFLKPSS